MLQKVRQATKVFYVKRCFKKTSGVLMNTYANETRCKTPEVCQFTAQPYLQWRYYKSSVERESDVNYTNTFISSFSPPL